MTTPAWTVTLGHVERGHERYWRIVRDDGLEMGDRPDDLLALGAALNEMSADTEDRRSDADKNTNLPRASAAPEGGRHAKGDDMASTEAVSEKHRDEARRAFTIERVVLDARIGEAQYIVCAFGERGPWFHSRQFAERVVGDWQDCFARALSRVEAEALERAARVAEEHSCLMCEDQRDPATLRAEIASEIRALAPEAKPTP